MLNVEEIEDWVGQDVFDSEGERVGKLEDVFYSAGTGEATFAKLKSGLLGRHSRLVALAGASVGRDYVRLAYTQAQIEDAGEEDVAESLGSEEALRLGRAYAIEVAPDEAFESAGVVKGRIQAAEEARVRADELAAQADRRAAEAQDAEASATDASREAKQKLEVSQRAREDAERAREQAESIERS
jgi:predicted negative regulator of RcsB-dependent stress response